jgi:hypothetical protein
MCPPCSHRKGRRRAPRRRKCQMRKLILTTAMALAAACRGGESTEPAYELAAITEVSNVGRAFDHWFIAQTECCNYTIRNWRTFSGFHIGGYVDLLIRNDRAFIRIGKKIGKENVLRAEQREGFDPLLSVVVDPEGKEYRTSDTASMPDGWAMVAFDANNKIQVLPKNSILPEGWHPVRGIPGRALPPVLRGKP